MQFINPQNEYPRHYGDIMLDVPGWQLGDNLPTGWVEVKSTEFPTAQANQIVEESAPLEVGGEWLQQWTVRDMTADEIAVRDAPATARAKLLQLGLSVIEIDALAQGLVR